MRSLLLVSMVVAVLVAMVTCGTPGTGQTQHPRILPCSEASGCADGRTCETLDGLQMCLFTCPASGSVPGEICYPDQFAYSPPAPQACRCVPQAPQGRACTTDAECGYAPGVSGASFLCANPEGPDVCLQIGTACAKDADCATGRCDAAKRLCDQACVPAVGEGCGCGGMIHCDGTCSKPAGGTVGHACGCGGTIQCDGTCSRPGASKLGQACGCGGTIRCDGSCSAPAPANLGQACGCGGSIDCSGACSAPGPGNLGQACGCGGSIDCSGACNAPGPGNLGQACGCGGTIQCDGNCNAAGPQPNDMVVFDLRHKSRSGCGHSYNEVRSRRCADGAVRVSAHATKFAGGNSHCSVVGWANDICLTNPNMKVGNSTVREACDAFFAAGASSSGDQGDCRYIFHVGTSGCDGLECDLVHVERTHSCR